MCQIDLYYVFSAPEQLCVNCRQTAFTQQSNFVLNPHSFSWDSRINATLKRFTFYIVDFLMKIREESGPAYCLQSNHSEVTIISTSLNNDEERLHLAEGSLHA